MHSATSSNITIVFTTDMAIAIAITIAISIDVAIAIAIAIVIATAIAAALSIIDTCRRRLGECESVGDRARAAAQREATGNGGGWRARGRIDGACERVDSLIGAGWSNVQRHGCKS